jgi:hypothetical protein
VGLRALAGRLPQAFENGVAVDLAKAGAVLADGVALRLAAAFAAVGALVAGGVVVRTHGFYCSSCRSLRRTLDGTPSIRRS